jgi:5'-methylthioadenosine phosphorylase
MRTSADVGVIGGSGFYSLFEDGDEVPVPTPYGEPAAPLTVGALSDRSVAFVPRHGTHHRFAPHRVPYRANLWALHSLGVRQVVAVSAVGSLTTALRPGSLVVPDQVVDRTFGRAQSLYDDHGVGHVSFADPYCPRGRAAAVTAGSVTDGGTLVVVNGPRFSSRAESQEFQAHGWSIIGMTGMPEAGLARELGMCFTLLALVTDLDAGVEAGAGVTHAEVLAAFAANLPRLRELLVATVARLPAEQGNCPCGDNSALPVSPPAGWV